MIISFTLNIVTIFIILISYLYLMNDNHIRLLNLLVIASVYFMGVSYLIEITGYTDWNLLILFLLIGMGQFYIKRQVNIIWNITAALFTWITFIMLQEIIVSLLFNLFAYSSWIPVLLSIQQLAPVSTGIVIIIVVLIRKKLMVAGAFLERSSWINIYFISTLVVALLMILIKGSGAKVLFASTSFLLNISTVYYPLVFAVFCLLILIIILDSKRAANQELIEQEEKSNLDYLNYVHELEHSYQELASFRHDYQNILLALDEGIQAGDLEQVKKVYEETIAPTSEIFKQGQNELVKLKHIKNSEVRSLFRVKVLNAQAKNIEAVLDIPGDVKEIGIPTIKFIRISSIILDNAIEGAEQASEKYLRISLFVHDDILKLIIRNSRREEAINIPDIYQLGKSNKQSKDRGVGLYSLRKILLEEPDVTVVTNIESTFFVQELSIQLSNPDLK